MLENMGDADRPSAGLLSFVLPVHNEAANVHPLHGRLTAIVEQLGHEAEFIYVNDGSTDESLAVLRGLARRDPRVVVIDFSRNFGHQIAVTAGLDEARGDAVVIMDTDLQDPPEVVFDLVAAWQGGADVAYAERRTRKDSWFKRTTASAYYRLLRRLSDIDIPANTGDFRLIDRRVVEELKKYREVDRYLRGMVSHVGFTQVAVPFDRDERLHGETGYPMAKMLKLAADGILGFSTFPLTVISRIGFLASGLAVLGALYALAMKLFAPQNVVDGWTFIVMSVLFVGGLQISMLGILGQYIGRIYREVQDRPLYTVRSVYRHGEGRPTAGAPNGAARVGDA
ncbi:dolichol-phosphate mannosyltransferase [Sinomonas atrocyanea]|nr:glycosyltransferase family 2 protein [Sinomonas atrocyanea]GEB63622.1 dolichol-phosphate mannosyltransferase [Sinomonas atrocyanea]GGG57927.1 dolichol-phosphate mannosyltransferase [Sinomonas atrocyanea]